MTDDEYAQWLILELAEQGRPAEIIAQMFASMVVASDMSPSHVLDEAHMVIEQTIELIKRDGMIWSRLLPGGNQQPLKHPDTERVHLIVDIMTAQDRLGHGDAMAWKALQEIADVLGIKHEANPEMVEVIVLSITESGWLVADKNSDMYEWQPVVFTNLSNPDADETTPGDLVLCPMQDFTDGSITPVKFADLVKRS